MAQWVRLTELGDRKCDGVRFDWDDIIGKENGGYNYVFTRTLGEIDPADNDGGFRFDITACNVVDFNLNGGVDVNYGFYNESTQEPEIYDEGNKYQGEYNGKEYYIKTSPGRITRWDWTEPLYYYGIHHIGAGSFDDEPVAAEDIYVRLYEGENVEPDEPVTPDEPTNPTIIENVNRIEQAKLDIKDAIRSKGVYVDDLDRIDTYASKIYEIGGGVSLGEAYVTMDNSYQTFFASEYGYDGLSIVTVDGGSLEANGYRRAQIEFWYSMGTGDGTSAESPYTTPQVIAYVFEQMQDRENMSTGTMFVKGTVLNIQEISGRNATFTIGYESNSNSNYPMEVYRCQYIDRAATFPEDGIKVGDNVVMQCKIQTQNYYPYRLMSGILISVETPEEGGETINPLGLGLKFAHTDITEVPEWAVLPAEITSITHMFNSCFDLTNISQLANWDMTNVFNISQSFYACDKLTDLTPIANWNTSNITNMSNMFGYCTKLTDTTPLNNWDVSKVNYITSPFTDSGITNGPAWDTSNWKRIQLFDGANKLVELPKYDARSLTSKPVLLGYRFSDLITLTTFGGLDNLKMSWDDTYGLCKCPNLTYESCINVLNGLYDFTGNGETPDTNQGILKVHQNFLDLVGDDINIGVNKGWQITV